MGVLDFLFEGSAPTPGVTSGTTTVQLPEWYTQYTTDMLGRAQAVANLPYAQYTGPRVAGFTPTERTGFEATQAAAGAFQPFLELIGQAPRQKVLLDCSLRMPCPEMGCHCGYRRLC